MEYLTKPFHLMQMGTLKVRSLREKNAQTKSFFFQLKKRNPCQRTCVIVSQTFNTYLWFYTLTETPTLVKWNNKILDNACCNNTVYILFIGYSYCKALFIYYSVGHNEDFC